MLNHLRISAVLLFALTLLTGVVYPAFVTVVAQVIFPHQANGSLLQKDGRTIGSALIGQSFVRPEYFWSRLSATPVVPFNAAASGGSNYGPAHPALVEAAELRMKQLSEHIVLPNSGTQVPVDLVTSSASGLDPHISPAAAEFQVSRVAAARHLPESEVRNLVLQHTEGRTFGVLGEPRVSVLRLNLALDQVQEGR